MRRFVRSGNTFSVRCPEIIFPTLSLLDTQRTYNVLVMWYEVFCWGDSGVQDLLILLDTVPRWAWSYKSAGVSAECQAVVLWLLEAGSTGQVSDQNPPWLPPLGGTESTSSNLCGTGWVGERNFSSSIPLRPIWGPSLSASFCKW